jgi:hypothetical protein
MYKVQGSRITDEQEPSPYLQIVPVTVYAGSSAVLVNAKAGQHEVRVSFGH